MKKGEMSFTFCMEDPLAASHIQVYIYIYIGILLIIIIILNLLLFFYLFLSTEYLCS